ncbi:MAG: type VI secretion system baseplate subunit TssG, partial [Acidobacteriota bacterium]
MGTTDGQSNPDVAASALVADAEATSDSNSPPEIPQRLREHPGEFSFFQAVRLMERLAGSREPLGSFDLPSQEPVRLAANPSLAFPRSEIESLVPYASPHAEMDAFTDPGKTFQQPPKMTINFFGLTGPSGVLPDRYTELEIERIYNRDTTLRDFLDIFNHRFASLLYRAWDKYRFPVAYERGGKDPFTGYMLDLIGLGTPGLQNRQAIPDQALICFEGLLAQFPRSAEGFRQVLSYYFDVDVEIHPFAGAWRPLDAGSRTCMEGGRSQSERLGIGMVLGDEV